MVVSTQSKCSIYKRPTTTLCSLMISRQRQPAKDCTKDHSLPSLFSLSPSPFSLLTSPSHLFFFFFFFYFFFSFPFFFGKKVGIMIAFNILIVPTDGRTDGRTGRRTHNVHPLGPTQYHPSSWQTSAVDRGSPSRQKMRRIPMTMASRAAALTVQTRQSRRGGTALQ